MQNYSRPLPLLRLLSCYCKNTHGRPPPALARCRAKLLTAAPLRLRLLRCYCKNIHGRPPPVLARWCAKPLTAAPSLPLRGGVAQLLTAALCSRVTAKLLGRLRPARCHREIAHRLRQRGVAAALLTPAHWFRGASNFQVYAWENLNARGARPETLASIALDQKL